jgi:hypothetical protein
MWRINVHQRLTSNPTWTQIGPGTTVVDNNPGGIWLNNNPNATLNPNVPPPMPGYTLDLLGIYLQRWERWTGITPSLQGAREPNISAGVAYSAMREAAQTRLRQIVRSFGQQLSEAGQMMLDLITHYGTGQMTSSVVSGEAAQRTEVNADEPRINGKPHPFRVLVAPSSDIPMSQAEVAQIMMALIPTGYVDAEGVLNALSIPGRQGMLERMRAAALAQYKQAVEEEATRNLQAEIERNKSEEMMAGAAEGLQQM